MITDEFNERIVANMEVALQRACERFPRELATHEARKRIAARLLERADRGERTLKGFTDAAITAATVISSGNHRSEQRPRLAGRAEKR
jgi:hypothetical protein